MGKTLLVLAAGMGTRYGGIKQIDQIGPSGECIMDYSVYDAIASGFDRVVFVIRRSFERAFREKVLDKINDKIRTDLAFQELENLPASFTCPPDRKKPWGTGHAIWIARDIIDEHFAVINADDFYGREAFRAMAEYFQSIGAGATGQYAMCGYRLENTLSDHGHVSRGVCKVNTSGKLQNVQEYTAIQKNANGQIISQKEAIALHPDDIVSMNFWGFTPDVFLHLDEKLVAFLTKNLDDPSVEIYIPFVVDELIRENKANVRVLQSKARWFGVTYKQDKATAAAFIRKMVTENIYPEKLW